MNTSLILRGAAVLAGMLTTFSCAVKEAEVDTAIPEYGDFYASFEEPEADTKVHADESMRVLWNADDHISIFNRYTYNQEYRFNGETGDNAGSFSKVENSDFVTGNAIDNIYAVYPYSAGTKISNDGVLTLTLPSEQSLVESNFGPGANVMVSAGADNNLLFKNVGGILAFKLYGENVSVSSISLSGNAGELLAGAATVSMPVGGVPSVEIQESGAATTVTLAASGAVNLGADAASYTECWFVLPPVTFSKGFTLTVTSPTGATFTKSTDKTVTIQRSRISRMAPIEVELEESLTPPDNEIWYTSTDGNIVEPVDPSVFDAGILSNTYENGRGVIRFDGPVTAIETLNGTLEAFVSATLHTVSLPESIEVISSGSFLSRSICQVHLPSHLKCLGDFAFVYCLFDEIEIPTTDEIGETPIYHNPNLSSIKGPYASADGRCLIKDGFLHTFAGCGLTEYDVPENVTAIARRVFEQQMTLERLSLPDGIIQIPEYAFFNCWSLKSIKLPSGLKYIDADAFGGCSALSDITLPESLLTLGDYAFSGDTSLSEVNIPSSLETVGINPFILCSAIKAFTGSHVSADNRCLTLGNKLVSFAPAGLTEYTLPSAVSSIGTQAFQRCSGLISVSVPEGIVHIGGGAFIECTSLKGMILPASWSTFDGNPFRYCRSLEEIVCKATVPPASTTGDTSSQFLQATNNCPIYVPAASVDAYKTAQYWSEYADRIQAIPEETQPDNEIWYTSTDGNIVEPTNPSVFNATIVSNTYENGKGVIRFEKEITSVGTSKSTYSSVDDSAFSRCQTLKSISFPESVENIYTFSLYQCLNLTDIKLPSHLSFLGSDAICGCGVTSMYVPQCDGALYNPFRDCTQLASFSGPSASEDGNFFILYDTVHSFAMCGKTEVTVPDGITRIAGSAFRGSSITEVHFPEALQRIESYAFDGCTSLKNINLPDALTTLGSYAFRNCSSLESVHIPEGTVGISRHVFAGCTSLNSFSGHYASADGRLLVINGSTYAFAPAGLESYVIPEEVDVVKDGFNHSSGLPGLKSLELHEGVLALELIGNSIETLILHSTTPVHINTYYFKIPCIKVIYVPASSVDAYKYEWSDYSDKIQALPVVQPDNEIWYTTTDGTVVKKEGSDNYAFNIDKYVISNTYEDGKGIIVFDTEQMTSLPMSAFEGCSNLLSISLPNSIKSVLQDAFTHCSSLSTFSGKFASDDGRCLIDDGKLLAFAPADILSYSLDDEIRVIRPHVFYECKNLESIVLPKYLEEIGGQAFQGCHALASVQVPETVKYIGYSAFGFCYSLSAAIIDSIVPPKADEDIFAYTGCPIYVPDSAIQAYSSADNWSNNSDRTRPASYYPAEKGLPYPVDLGLPSGVKWCSCNLGATSLCDSGKYFSWGETSEKEYYEWSYYKWCNNGSYSALTKYNTLASYGVVDNITALEPEDDAAYVLTSGKWRIPSEENFEELRNSQYCVIGPETIKGISGHIVRSSLNRRSIFLPQAGVKELDGIKEGSCYWLSEIHERYPYYAKSFRLQSYLYSSDMSMRDRGLPIRPVCD